MSFSDDANITDGSPISQYLAIPVPNSVAGRENVMGAFTTLLDGWRYGADDESALSQWHENNQAFWTLAAIDMEAVDNMKVAVVWDEKLQGTNGGTFTSGAWRQRDLNTKSDPDGLVNIEASNVQILQNGKYWIKAIAPARYVGRHQTRLVKNGELLAQGSSSYSNLTYSNSIVSSVSMLYTGDIITLQHQCSGGDTGSYGMGMGDSSNFGNEIYSVMEIIKLD